MAQQQEKRTGIDEEDARLVLEALGRRQNREAPTAWEKQDKRWIAALRREDDLRKFLDVFDGLKEKADEDAAKNNELQDRMNRLRAEYARLGFLQGRRKKEISAQIGEILDAAKEAEYNAARSKEKLLGYTSRAQIESDLEAALDAIDDLERQKLGTYQSGGYALSFSSAVAQYKERPGVAALVDQKLGAAGPCYLAQFGLREVVSFGQYPQKGDAPEPIRWLVGGEKQQEKKSGSLLLVSLDALDCKPFDESGSTDWKTSSLRRWLNGEFLERAFTPAQQSLLMSSSDDKAWLLDRDGVDRAFALTWVFSGHRSVMSCTPTPYAQKMGAWTKDGVCAWWVNEPCRLKDDSDKAGRRGILVFPPVNYTGKPEDDWGYGAEPDMTVVGVRPAIRLDVSSLEKLRQALG